MTTGIFTLVGVVLGALITAGTQFVVARWHGKSQFRLAAIERRLNVHQTAYELCYRMRSSMHNRDKQGLVQGYEQWWLQNCLFLGPRSRDSINVLFSKWSLYDPDKKDNAEMNALSRCFKSTVDTLVAEVSLPAVAYDDKLFE